MLRLSAVSTRFSCKTESICEFHRHMEVAHKEKYGGLNEVLYFVVV